MTIHFVIGGVRSGKSRYAMQLALELSSNPIYVATAHHWDDEFNKRITQHVENRDIRWTTIEEEKYLSKIDLRDKTVVIDCITLWLANFLIDAQQDIDKIVNETREELDKVFNNDCSLIIVSNEVGMSIHPATELGVKFADLQGLVNKYIAHKANRVTLMVAGIPVHIK